MKRTSIVHSGHVTLTPRMIALPRRSSSGMGNVAMYPTFGLPSSFARDPASMPARYFIVSMAPKKLPKFVPLDLYPVRWRYVMSGNSSATVAIGSM